VLSASFYLPAEFGKPNVSSLELHDEPYHYVSFTTTLANMITYYEFGSLGPMYGLIPHEILHIATSTLTWAVQLRSSYNKTSNFGGLQSDLVVLTNTLNQNRFDNDGPDVKLVVSPANNAVSLDLPTTPDSRCSHSLGRFWCSPSTGHFAHSLCPGLR
jgi:hypothetical protein